MAEIVIADMQLLRYLVDRFGRVIFYMPIRSDPLNETLLLLLPAANAVCTVLTIYSPENYNSFALQKQKLQKNLDFCGNL